jgi:hypothetical protein
MSDLFTHWICFTLLVIKQYPYWFTFKETFLVQYNCTVTYIIYCCKAMNSQPEC